ncbi:MAG: hypothetical protein KDB36_15295 [Acidimicrobiales bacterium]|nr:hypothetical protein [Acidimicrobiales bacterium]
MTGAHPWTQGNQYLFSMAGDWIAFRIDAYVFDPYSNVIGWLPFDTPDVFDLSGSWMGTIQPDGRFFAPRRVEHRRAPKPPLPPRPDRPPHPPRPTPMLGPPGSTEVVIPRPGEGPGPR